MPYLSGHDHEGKYVAAQPSQGQPPILADKPYYTPSGFQPSQGSASGVLARRGSIRGRAGQAAALPPRQIRHWRVSLSRQPVKGEHQRADQAGVGQGGQGGVPGQQPGRNHGYRFCFGQGEAGGGPAEISSGAGRNDFPDAGHRRKGADCGRPLRRGHQSRAAPSARGETLYMLRAAIRHGGGQLADFKTPKLVRVQEDPLPRTSTGRVQKFLLAERFARPAAE